MISPPTALLIVCAVMASPFAARVAWVAARIAAACLVATAGDVTERINYKRTRRRI